MARKKQKKNTRATNNNTKAQIDEQTTGESATQTGEDKNKESKIEHNVEQNIEPITASDTTLNEKLDEQSTQTLTIDAEIAQLMTQPNAPEAESTLKSTLSSIESTQHSDISDAKDTKKAQSTRAETSENSIITQQGDRKNTMAPSTNDTSKTEAKKANKTTESTPTPAPVIVQKSGSGFATTMASFAFILSVAAGGGIYWTWQQMQIEKAESASTISTLQQQLESELRKSQAALQSDLSSTQAAIKSELTQASASIRSELDSKAAAIEALTKNIESTTSSKIAGAEERFVAAQAELGKANHSIKETQKRQQSLEISIDGLYSRIGNTSRDWVIAEADYLLKIANHRLQLEQDVTTSIQALTLADQRINSLQDPALTEVRNVIAQELVTLQTLPIPDQAGIAMQLTELQNRIDKLPLNARTLPTQQALAPASADDAMKVESWEALPSAIWGVLEDLITVSYNDKPMEALLSPTQVKHLHENLKLKLEQARMVLLRGDQALYTANMDLAINWTEEFFNTEEIATKKFIDTLTYLKGKQVILQVPDISSSLRALRKVSRRLEIHAPGINNNASNATPANSADVAIN